MHNLYYHIIQFSSVCGFIDSTPRYMSTSTSQTPTPTPPGPPIQPEVGQVTRENSECLYPSQAAAIAITTILALLLALLFSFAALLFLFLRYSHSRHVSKKSSEVCYLPSEESTKGALNHSFENKEEVTSFNENEPGMWDSMYDINGGKQQAPCIQLITIDYNDHAF